MILRSSFNINIVDIKNCKRLFMYILIKQVIFYSLYFIELKTKMFLSNFLKSAFPQYFLEKMEKIR